MTTAKLLGDLADLMITQGPDSAAVRDFIRQHGDNEEFAELAETALRFKRALAAPSRHSGNIEANEWDDPESKRLFHEFTDLLCQVGPDDPAIQAFMEENEHRTEFAELARTAIFLKRQLMIHSDPE